VEITVSGVLRPSTGEGWVEISSEIGVGEIEADWVGGRGVIPPPEQAEVMTGKMANVRVNRINIATIFPVGWGLDMPHVNFYNCSKSATFNTKRLAIFKPDSTGGGQFSRMSWMASSTFSASTPIIKVLEPRRKNPPLEAMRVTRKLFEINA
jgi:hypothetical protein